MKTRISPEKNENHIKQHYKINNVLTYECLGNII